MDQNSPENSIVSEKKREFISFFQNYLFSPYFWGQMYISPILIGILFLIIRKDDYLWVILHLCLCYSIASVLGVVNIKKRLLFFLKNYEKYSTLVKLQKKLTEKRSPKQIMSRNVLASPKYVFYRDYKFWTSGEALMAVLFLILYAIPVFLPVALYFETIKTHAYFILYPPFLLYTTNSFFAFSGFIFWEKRLKKQVEKGETIITAR